MLKRRDIRITFGSWAVEKVHAAVARSTCRSQNVKKAPRSNHFWTFNRHFSVASAMDSAPCHKWAMWGYCSSFKNDGRRGNFEESLQRCSLGGMRNAKDISIRHVRRSRPGRRFPEMGCILEHYIIIRLAKMILVDRCSTSYDPAPLLPGRRSTLDRWGGKIAKRIGTKPSALRSTFHFWRKYRRIASFFDVVNVEK